MNINIREAFRNDLPSVLRLYSQFGMDDGDVLDLEKAEYIFDKMKFYPDYKLHIASIDDCVVGIFALLIMDNLGHMGARSGVIEDVVVRKDLRGQGIGRRMMEFAMERCRDKGCYKITMSSNLLRGGTHRFYESLGYKKHGFSFLVETRQEAVCR
ncbi:MAG: GNAT family N-acetyltransferase [Dissulfurispiraceae bacterium]|jgi:GNAT superfamily N-acetyltransferase